MSLSSLIRFAAIIGRGLLDKERPHRRSEAERGTNPMNSGLMAGTYYTYELQLSN